MTNSFIEAEVRRASDLGPIIAGVREARGIRQVDLADELGFARSYLASLESGRPVIQLNRLFRVLRRLGIRITVSFDTPGMPPKDETDRA